MPAEQILVMLDVTEADAGRGRKRPGQVRNLWRPAGKRVDILGFVPESAGFCDFRRRPPQDHAFEAGIADMPQWFQFNGEGFT